MKLLMVLFTHNEYSHLLSKIWDRLSELDIPSDFSVVDKLVITEEIDTEIVNLAKLNDYKIETTVIPTITDEYRATIDKFVGIKDWNIDRYWKICEMRNFYLNYANENGYDYLLQVDGDVLPPTDGFKKLYDTGKKYVGAAVYIKQRPTIKYADLRKSVSNYLYESYVVGNCFHLEHKDCFNYKYELAEHHDADSWLRSENLRKDGFKIYCETSIQCEHLE